MAKIHTTRETVAIVQTKHHCELIFHISMRYKGYQTSHTLRPNGFFQIRMTVQWE